MPKHIAIMSGTVLLLLLALLAACSPGKETEEAKAEHKDEAHEGEAHEEEGPPGVVSLDPETVKALNLEVSPVRRRAVANTIQVTGVVRPNQTRVTHIRVLSRGRIEDVHVQPGERVQSGQRLITYDNVELGVWINEYRSAIAARESTEAEVEVTRRALERAQNLVSVGAIAASEVERRQADYKRASASMGNHTAAIVAAEEKIRRAGVDPESVRKGLESNTAAPSNRVVISAPFEGVVTGFDVTRGEIVETGEDLLTLTDLSAVWVQANVSQRDVSAIREGQRVRVSIDSYPDKTFGGTITYVSDVLDPETRTVQVRCEVANPRRELKLDMFARIQISTSGTAQRLVIASEAVQLIDDKPYVFVKTGDAEFRQREIQIGAQGEDWVEVREGVAEGEPVVVRGAFSLKSAVLKEQIGGEDHH